MSSRDVFPIRVGISYDFGLVGEDFSKKSLKSGEVEVFVSTSGFNYFYNSDGPRVLKKRLNIDFREEEKDRIKEYFNNLVENSWDKMKSFFGSYGVRLPEREKVSESLSESFINYLKGITSFFNEIFVKYRDIEYGLKRVPLSLDDIKELASEVSKSCLYSIRIKDSNEPYVYLSFSDIKEVINIDDEETHPLKKLEKINLTTKDLEHLEEWDLYEKEEEDSDDSTNQNRIKELKEKSKKVREVLEELAEAVFYGDGFVYLNSQSIDEVLHKALSMGGRFYSLFPKVDVVEGPGGEGEFLVITNIVDRTASLEGQKVPFPAILVSIETSAKRENGNDVKLAYEETEEIGPIRVGFGFLIELSNTFPNREYGNPFYEDEAIENIEFSTDNEEEPIMVEKRSLYFVFLRTKINFKSGAMRCPVSFSYISLKEKRVFDLRDEVMMFIPKVFFTSLVFESPESRDLGLESFTDIYRPLLGEGKTEVGLSLRNLLPQDSLVTSIASSYLGFVGLREADEIKTPFGLYNGGKYSRVSWMDSVINYGLVPIAAHKPEEVEKKGEEYKEKSEKKLIVSDLELYKHFIFNSGAIERTKLHPFLSTVIAEKYISKGKSDLCFSHGEEAKVKLTPKSWEEAENEIKKHLPFKKVDGTKSWEYRSENVSTYLRDETMDFSDYTESYFAEKTKVAVNYEEKVNEKTDRGLFFVMSWTAQVIKREVGDVEQVRRKLFGE
jgi:hypothetical protein